MICEKRVHMKMSPKSILGNEGLSQDATGDDATIWNLRRKESGSGKFKMLQLAIKLQRDHDMSCL